MIFWGQKFFEGSPGPGVLTELRALYLGMREGKGEPGEHYWEGILTQYNDAKGPGPRTVQVPAFWEIHESPGNVTNASVEAKIEQAVREHRVTPTPNTQFIVAIAPKTNLSEFPKLECGFHSVDNEGYSYSVVPYAGDVGCEYGAGPVHETTGTAAHEFAESATDPQTSLERGYEGRVGWAVEEAGGTEIADICPLKAEQPPEDFWYAQQIYDRKKHACSLTDPPYEAPPPPLVGTAGSGSVGTTNATVYGEVDPNELSTTYDFQYGTTTEYGSSTTPGNARWGTNIIPVQSTITQLQPATTYHYRIVASSWSGTSFGQDHTFKTLPLPPVVATGPAISVKQEYAGLTGTVNPEGGKTRYFWEYGTTTAYGSITPNPEETIFEYSGGFQTYEVQPWSTGKLLPNTTYHFRIAATSEGGTSHGIDREFHTSYNPIVIAAEATPIGKSEATLRSTLNPEGAETTYQFEYWSGNNEIKYAPTSSTSVGAGTSNVNVNQTITGISEDTAYTYRVRATNSSGTMYGPNQNLTPRKPLATQPAATAQASTSLKAISCTAEAACTGVGSLVDREGITDSLAERWGGSSWQQQSTIDPAGAKATQLTGVSCVSATSCTAAGYYTNSAGTVQSLVEHWTGSEWAIQSTPNVTEGSTQLYAVSCTSTTFCMAVGQGGGNGIVEQWNGSQWKLVTASIENAEAKLTGVSCTSATFCNAVGIWHHNVKAVAYAEQWTGTEWKITTELARHNSEFQPEGVSCTSSTSCTTVGWTPNGSGSNVTSAYRWSGGEWNLMTTPNLGGATSSYLRGVSCASSTACSAVGDGESSGVNSLLAEQWNGTEWKVETVATPSWASGGALTGVFCTAASTCKATGEATDGSPVALAETWGGTSWQIQGDPGIAEAKVTALYATSCASATLCMAVGHAETNVSIALAEQLSGSEWKTLKTPDPAGAKATQLTGVSCVSATWCTAAGYDTNSAGTIQSLVEHWNGSEWKIQATPNLSEGEPTQLYGVSCTSTTACTAVGQGAYLHGDGIAEQWNGSEWKLVITPTPPESHEAKLTAVSCATASACTAVGYWRHGAKSDPYAEQWNGSAWKEEEFVAHREIRGLGVQLEGVSCTSPTSCTTVGWSQSSSGLVVPVAEQWNGAEWFPQATPPNGPNNRYVTSVACASASECTAGGYFKNEAGVWLPYMMRWSNKEWTAQEAQGVSGSIQSEILGVACPAARECEAVGSGIALGGGGVALVDHFSPEWTVRSTVMPSGGTAAHLASVACASPNECLGVGEYRASTGTKTPLIEQLTGTSWSLLTPAVPSGAKASTLSAIACPAAHECVGTGSYTSSSGTVGPLAVHWNGYEWWTQTTPVPSEAKEGQLAGGVACAGTTECLAVGSFVSSAGETLPLAELWDGREWLVRAVPVPSGAKAATLHGITCRTSSLCIAAGEYTTSAGVVETLAERWSGTEWTILTTPNPTGATSSVLSGVSCWSATECTAVGRYVNSSGTSLTLAERWNGSAWTVQATSNPAGTARLSGVSCLSAGECTASGEFTASSGAVTPLVEFWNGNEWVIEPASAPSGAKGAHFLGVTCASAYACVAPGEYQNSAGESLALAEDTDGEARVYAQQSNITAPMYLGSFGSSGSGNGQFNHPGDVAIDTLGRFWVVDRGNDRIELFNESGEFLNAFGSKGSGNGQFSNPSVLAVDAAGHIWVADTGNARVEVLGENGEFLKAFGSYGSANGQFKSPEGIAIGPHSEVVVSDTGNGRLQIFNMAGEFQKTISSKGSNPGQLGEPENVGICPSGSIWVSDWQNDRAVKFKENGEYLLESGSKGTGNGQFTLPYGLAVDGNCDAWVADTADDRVEELAPNGEYLTQFGSGTLSFSYPIGLAVNGRRELWVTDPGNSRITHWG